MGKIAIYLPDSREDLHAIWSYAVDQSQSDEVADRLVSAIDERIQLYALNPEIGTPRFELASGLRCLTASGYVVFYMAIADGIEVIQIIHGARDLPAHFRRPPQ